MKVTLDDIRQKFDALESGAESWEEIADFAMRAMQADDSRLLEMEPAFADQIWRAILYLSGVDLKDFSGIDPKDKDNPGRYLHSIEDFVDMRKQLGV